MLIPNKYENINNNILVLGFKVTKELKKQPYNIDRLYQKLKKEINISLDTFYDVITFLWLSEIIEKRNYQIFLRKK
jgi:Fe2+ or Zn2+ uptake regulation protein